MYYGEGEHFQIHVEYLKRIKVSWKRKTKKVKLIQCIMTYASEKCTDRHIGLREAPLKLASPLFGHCP